MGTRKRRVASEVALTMAAGISELGGWIIATIGEPASRGLLNVLTRPEHDRAALIGRLSQYEGAAGLAELLIDIESDPDGITRLHVVEALRRAL